MLYVVNSNVDLFNVGDKVLSNEDRNDIHAFNLLVNSGMSRGSYNYMRFTFRNQLSVASQYVIFRKAAILAGVKPVLYDCCPQSCIAYTTKYIHHQSCPFCEEPRFKPDGKPCRQFTYFPLIPHLQGFFRSPVMIKSMSYRNRYQSKPGSVSDVFDGNHYQRLLRHRVVVDGEKLKHHYFSDPHDIALALATDTYLLYKRCRRKAPSATPILLQNYNLPPHIRTHLCNLICIGIIPGPQQPKDLTSFLTPLDDEAAKLAYGIPTFDTKEKTQFVLHAYIIFKLGDIIVIEKFLNIKGHNAIFPCRSCEIQAVCGTGKIHYVPLTPPLGDSEQIHWDPNNLPLRRHKDFLGTCLRLDAAKTKTERARIAKESGVKGLPALSRVGSLDYARSIPWEWFHLLP